MVHANVWAAAGMLPMTVRPYNESDGDFLCVQCIEARLGRRLTPRDFTAAPINDPAHPWMSARLAARMEGI